MDSTPSLNNAKRSFPRRAGSGSEIAESYLSNPTKSRTPASRWPILHDCSALVILNFDDAAQRLDETYCLAIIVSLPGFQLEDEFHPVKVQGGRHVSPGTKEE
jgi:hypothetical protein